MAARKVFNVGFVPIITRGGSRIAATSKMKNFVIIVNGWKLEVVNYYYKALHLGCCSSPGSASDYSQYHHAEEK